MAEFIPGTNIKMPRQILFPQQFNSKNTLDRHGAPFLLDVTKAVPNIVEFTSTFIPQTSRRPSLAATFSPDDDDDFDNSETNYRQHLDFVQKENNLINNLKSSIKYEIENSSTTPISPIRPELNHNNENITFENTTASPTENPVSELSNCTAVDPDTFPNTDDFIVEMLEEEEEEGTESMPYFPKQTIKSSKLFKCIYCADCFLHMGDFAQHLKDHECDVDAEGQYACECCARKFEFPLNLMRHVRSQHASMTCQFCNRTFAKFELLSRHLRCHADGSLEECVNCHRCYDVGPAMDAHMRAHYGEFKLIDGKYVPLEFKCQYCSETRTAKWLMDEHMKSHTGQSTLSQCRVCGKQFRHKPSLEQHVQRFHTQDEPQTCDICGKVLRSKFSLGLHRRRLHGDLAVRKERDVDCPLCDRKFLTKGARDRHYDCTHTNVRKYVCQECGADFGFPSSYLKHLKIHKEGRPYKPIRRWHRKSTVVVMSASDIDE